MNIVVIGSGMYVSGRGTNEYGTVMPAICEWKRLNPGGEVHVVGTHGQRIQQTKMRVLELQKKMKVQFKCYFYPENTDVIDSERYQKILKKILPPKVAIIAVPDHLHYEVSKEALQEGFHTLVAKPLVPSFQEASDLYTLQKKMRVHCVVEFHKRFDAANLKLKEAFKNNEIGAPLYFLIEYSQRKHIPIENFISWVRHSNVFQYLGVHYVDMIYFVTGALPQRVMALGQKHWLVQRGIDNYDAIQGVIEWQDRLGQKFLSYILTHWVDPLRSPALSNQKIQLIGTKGTFSSDQKMRGIEMVTDEGGTQQPSPYYTFGYHINETLNYEGYGIESIMAFLKDVFLIVKDQLQLSEISERCPTFRQALVSCAVIDGINQSLNQGGRWIKVPEIFGLN